MKWNSILLIYIYIYCILQYIFKQKLNNISVEFGNHFDNEAECTAGTYNINAPDRPDVCTNWCDFCCWNTFLDQLQIEMSNSVNALKEKINIVIIYKIFWDIFGPYRVKFCLVTITNTLQNILNILRKKCKWFWSDMRASKCAHKATIS